MRILSSSVIHSIMCMLCTYKCNHYWQDLHTFIHNLLEIFNKFAWIIYKMNNIELRIYICNWTTADFLRCVIANANNFQPDYPLKQFAWQTNISNIWYTSTRYLPKGTSWKNISYSEEINASNVITILILDILYKVNDIRHLKLAT